MVWVEVRLPTLLLSAVCASTMGISVPMAVRCLFVELAQPKKFSAADVFGDDLEN